MSSGILLCRGNSLSRIHELNSLDIADCFIVNEWYAELDMTNISFFLESRNIIAHYINRETISILPTDYYEKFNIQYCQLNVLQDEYEKSKIRKFLNASNIVTKPLDERMIPYSTDGEVGFPSMGVVALVHMSVCLDIKNIYVIGMDFFEDDYYTHHSYYRTKGVHDYQIEKNKPMGPFVENFIKTQPNRMFTFYTNSKTFNPESENVKIIRGS